MYNSSALRFLSYFLKPFSSIPFLVGCASGTLIAFIIPALLSFRLEGYTNLAMLIFVVGGTVGTFGTYYSVKQLAADLGAH
jgi:hypothetical protein